MKINLNVMAAQRKKYQGKLYCLLKHEIQLKCWNEHGEKGTLITLLVRLQTGPGTLEISVENSQKIKMNLP